MRNFITSPLRLSLISVALFFLISTHRLYAASNKYLNWGISQNNIASINLPDITHLQMKREVIVAVIDSGVDFNHPYIKPNLVLKKEILGDQDKNGHGTHIAGIIKSVFPKVKILPIKYYKEGAKSYENVQNTIDAIRYAVKMKVDIINYSSGGDGANVMEKQALLDAEKAGILVVVAAGNNGRNIDRTFNHYYPANYNLNNILTVVNHNQSLRLSSSSNYGEHTAHISAPGTRIKSSYVGGRTGYLSGTSQATAFVTGVAALIKAYAPKLSFSDIKNIILKSSKKEKFLQGKCLTGARLDAKSALELAMHYIRKVSYMP